MLLKRDVKIGNQYAFGFMKFHYIGNNIAYGMMISNRGAIVSMLRDYPHGKRIYPITGEMDYTINPHVYGRYIEIIRRKLQKGYHRWVYE